MAKVLIYTTATCPYCYRARRLLTRREVAFEEVRIDRDAAQRQTMLERSGRDTVPQIFIGERHIGGYDDLVELDADGGLDELRDP
ncbi:glutaredoxin 3 [Thioalkalicoccus limnaeus]|uniref:Glutaredoxin n=1 Tax=Thioalkalicoccus limnaeus TaxID=120681 RepID=A0ABV4BCJ1_9GAMM